MQDFFHFTVMDALGGSEQHQAFSQETKESSHMLTALRTWLFFFIFFYPHCSIFMNLILCLHENMTLAEISQKRVFFFFLESWITCKISHFSTPNWVKHCRDITAWCQAEIQEGFRWVSSPRGPNAETLWWQRVTGRMRITSVSFAVCVCV